MRLSYEAHIGIGDPLLDQDLRDLGVAMLPAGMTLVAGTGPAGGLVSYRLSEGAVATLVDTVHFSGAAASGQTGLAAPVGEPDRMSLAFGSAADGGGVAILAQELTETGGFGATVTLADLPQGGAVSALVAAQIGEIQTLFVADGGTGRLLVYRPGAAPPVRQAPAPAPALDGSAILSLAEGGAGMHLLALDQSANALRSFTIDAASGALGAEARLDGTGGLAIADPTAMEVVRAHGATWAVIGAAGSDSLSVVRIESDGAMTLVDHVIDTLGTRFGGVHGLALAQSGDHVFVVAGGADDGLSLFRLLSDGRLLHLESLAHAAGLGLENVGQLSATVLGQQLQLFVAGDPRGGLSQFSLDLSTLGLVGETGGNAAALLSGTAEDDLLTARGFGDDTLSGGSGDDILVAGPGETELRGGGGGDLFVIPAGAGRVRITDFTPGSDRLDLSALPMLRGPGQLDIAAGLGFARVSFRDTMIEITATASVLLDSARLFGPVFDWPDRLPILSGSFVPPIAGTPGADALEGTSSADVIEGREGNDTLFGLGGQDRLAGGEGHDLLGGGPGDDSAGGGAGNDSVFGSDGRDTLDGGEGDDELGGGPGDDSLIGGPGRDRLFGAADDDTLLGGAGADLLGGAAGNDLLFGGGWHDELWGSDGNDTLWGEAGDDTLGGAAGHDAIHGGPGADEIWASFGDDSGTGGEGNDTIGLYFGNDLAEGATGDDQLWGAAGDDTLSGGEGRDTIGGGGGDDSIEGGAGADTLWGGSGRDVLDGGAGDDLISGGSDADSFVFADGHGSDTIGDFDSGSPGEWIDLRGITALATFEEALAASTQAGPDLRIDTGGGGALLLRDLTASDLSADDFLF